MRKGLKTARDAYNEVQNNKPRQAVKKTTKKPEKKQQKVTEQDKEELRRLMESLGGDL